MLMFDKKLRGKKAVKYEGNSLSFSATGFNLERSSKILDEYCFLNSVLAKLHLIQCQKISMNI